VSSVELARGSPALRRRALAAAGGLTALTLAAAALVGRVRPGEATSWAVAAGAVLAVELGLLYANLDDNRPAGCETGGDAAVAGADSSAAVPLSPVLGGANAVTLLRGALFAWVAGFVVVPPTGTLMWVPAALYGAGVSLDAVDGALARATGRVTPLGETLDVEVDSLGFVVAPLVGVLAGHLPAPYLAVSVAHYAFLGGRRLRELRGLPTFDLPDRPERRVLAAVQMAFIAAALAPATPPLFGTVGAVLSGGPVLLGFARDWLYVSGRLSE
jgi:CDP-diacylglycerol--glycerol-3-phosphate 3-phosphatidyltransferase